MGMDIGGTSKGKSWIKRTQDHRSRSVSRDSQSVPTAMEVELRKVEDQSKTTNAGTEGMETEIGKTKVEVAWIKKTMKPNHPMT